MEAGTVGAGVGTGSKTIADLLPLAAERYAEKVAIKHKAGEDWVDVSYEELGRMVKEVGLGLIELGIAPGDKVSILATPAPSGATPASASSRPGAPWSPSTRRTPRRS